MPHSSTALEIELAFTLAKALPILPFEKRVELLHALKKALEKHKEHLAHTISEEMGKPLWDARSEIDAAIQKIPLSLAAFQERCAIKQDGRAYRRFKPHGVVAVFGPFNFPIHLPNGHIVPAFLAGNKVLFKPSEYTPRSAAEYFKLFEEAGFPHGFVQLVQGGKEVGQKILDDERLDGLFFTGSAKAGIYFSQLFAKTPGKILALEMGGNNPLAISKIGNLDAAVCNTLISAYLTSGQRCTCARRLIVIDNVPFIEKLIEKIPQLAVGPFDAQPEPFMGPLISAEAAEHVLKKQENLGGKILVPCRRLNAKTLTPGLIDVTGVSTPDEEIFGPLLQLIRVKHLEEAIDVANDTDYGLVSALFSADAEEWRTFYERSKTGLINWNAPTTGALSSNPFGGTGMSGNHRPSAYFAADYCSYVLAGIEAQEMQLKTFPGMPYG